MATATIVYKEHWDYKTILGVFLGDNQTQEAENYIKPFNDQSLNYAIALETTKWRELMLKEGIKEEHIPKTAPEHVVKKAKQIEHWYTEEVEILTRELSNG